MILLAIALAAGPVVRTDDGPVRGATVASGGAVFRGIPFAKPPIGALRWRAPERPVRWTRPRAAIDEHAACPQIIFGEWNRRASESGDEDCLLLDVQTPTLAPAARLPVMVWIHGGSNRAGGGGLPGDGSIPRAGVVLVSIQYRLGALGFLSHPALSREQGGRSGNYGLMDQQAALRWVRRNIARFGGDPARVTIAGESAGAMDVGLHMLAPGSRGLFARAIEESGTAGFGTPPRTLAENEALGDQFAGHAGLRTGATAAQLRALPVATVLAADRTIDVPVLADDDYVWLQAIVDGRVLPDTPARLLAAGRTNPAPLIVGMNARELPLHGGPGAAAATVRQAFGDRAETALRLYGLQPGGTPIVDPRLGDVATQLANDLTFRCPAATVASALSGRGGAVWQYQFDHTPPGGTVTHGSEIAYVMRPPAPGEPPMQAYWLNFVKRGDPNGDALPQWPRYTPADRAYMAFDQTRTVAKAGLRDPVCALRSAP